MELMNVHASKGQGGINPLDAQVLVRAFLDVKETEVF